MNLIEKKSYNITFEKENNFTSIVNLLPGTGILYWEIYRRNPFFANSTGIKLTYLKIPTTWNLISIFLAFTAKIDLRQIYENLKSDTF